MFSMLCSIYSLCVHSRRFCRARELCWCMRTRHTTKMENTIHFFFMLSFALCLPLWIAYDIYYVYVFFRLSLFLSRSFVSLTRVCSLLEWWLNSLQRIVCDGVWWFKQRNRIKRIFSTSAWLSTFFYLSLSLHFY